MPRSLAERYTPLVHGLLRDQATLRQLHDWAEDNHVLLAPDVAALNHQLNLRQQEEIKADFLCLAVGSQSGLVLLSANPGWKAEHSERGRRFVIRRRGNYWRLSKKYFRLIPMLGAKSRWWNRAFPYTEILGGLPARAQSRRRHSAWYEAYRLQRFGGWELIPLPSSKDGISSKIEGNEVLLNLARASVTAVLALAPKVLLVGHKVASKIIRERLHLDWQSHELTGNIKMEYARQVTDGRQTEIVLIYHQFISARRKFRRTDIMQSLYRLREQWERKNNGGL